VNPSEQAVAWLLAEDPSVAWQAQRDLLGRAASTWSRTRGRVAREGWGARLLALRDEHGMWGGGLYQPKWTSTFYSMRLLVHLGISPTHRPAKASCRLLLDEGVRETGGVALWNSGTVDVCVTAMLLSMACYFGFDDDPRCDRMVQWLLDRQMHDGGWNCQKTQAQHASFHSSISVLEGFCAFTTRRGADARVDAATAAGRDYFLRHHLYRSERTGAIVRPGFAKLSFPPRWYFDVLRGLEYFSSIEAAWDERLADAVQVVESARGKDGKWRAQNWHTGKVHFRLQGPREPSAMNTLRALRVLRWAERARG